MNARCFPVPAMPNVAVSAVLVACLSVTACADVNLTVRVGDTSDEARNPIRLRSFGKPVQKGGRWCRNSDETGVGDNKAGYAAVSVPAKIEPTIYEFVMSVWGQSSEFSFVAHNGRRYRTVAWGRPSGRPEWEDVRFVLTPKDLDSGSKEQRFGFASRDRQVWVSRIEFRAKGQSREGREALIAERSRGAGRVILAAAGYSDYVIVIDPHDNAVMQYAANEMQRYIYQISDAYLPVRGPGSGTDAQRVIRISADATALGSLDGFSVATRGNHVRISGGSPLGAVYGTYAFLESLGCRWCWPGPDGEVVPKHDPLVVPELDIREKPDFKIRWVGGGDWALKNRCNVNLSVNGVSVGCVWKWSFHSFYSLLRPDVYWDSHPEYYPLLGNTRRAPKSHRSIQICTANPEARAFVAQNVIHVFKQEPRTDIAALCPNDGGGFCTGPCCRALDRPNPDFWGRYSDRLAPFNNAVARRVALACPDKLIKTGAYAMYMRYPLQPRYKPAPNMAVQACHTYSCNNHPIDSDCERNREYFRKPLEKWAKNTKHLWIYEYYIKGAWAHMLYTQTHVIPRDIPYYRRIGAEGFYTQWSSASFHNVGLDYYVAARLLWDTRADVDALIRDYCEAFYEKAGGEMYRFHRTLEQAFVRYDDHLSPFGYKHARIAAPEIFTPSVLRDLDAHLSRAEKLTPKGVVSRRIKPTRLTFEYTRRIVDYLRSVAGCFDGVASPDSAGFAAAEAKARELGERTAADVIDFLQKHGLGSYVRSDRSKVTALLRSHRNPQGVVARWWQTGAKPSRPSRRLPPIEGSQIVGRVSAKGRVRLDAGDHGLARRWFAVECDESDWRVVPFPSYWQDAGVAKQGYRGLGWYRVDVELPATVGKDDRRYMLRFEGVDAAATVFLNGVNVGEHAYVPGRSWQNPFELDVTGRARPGKNLLALRVYTGGGKGGVYGKVIAYRLGDKPEDFMR